MGKITCKGRMCKDEETGAVFFLPDPECNPEAFAKVKEGATNTGIAFIKPNAVPKEKSTKKKKV